MANEFAPRKTDAALNPAAKTLPSAQSTTVYTASMDLNAVTPFIPGNVEFQLVTPALNTTQLPDSRTVTYALQDSADDSSFATILTLNEATQTGASSAGAASGTVRFSPPSDVRRYIRVAITTGASTGDCSAASATFTIRCAP
jgi:hypothetical protein